MFHELWELRRFQAAKVTFKANQGHWQLCGVIAECTNTAKTWSEYNISAE